LLVTPVGGNLFDESGVTAFFGRLEYGSEFYGLSVSQVCCAQA